MKFNNILIIGAHYDDAELGVGGTAARLVSEGKSVYKITLTDNVTHSEELHINVDYESSKYDSRRASHILGVKEIEFNPVECNKLLYTTQLMQRIEKIIFEKQIDTIFMHFEDDYNQDHIEAYKLCKTASRHCKNIFTYQSNGYLLPTVYYPSILIDISDFASKKIEALGCYHKEHDRFNRLFDTTLDRNRVWGYAAKTNYAEAFHPVKITY